MPDANFILETYPFRLTRQLEADTDVFLVARDVAEAVLAQSVIEERVDYLGIPHEDTNVPSIMQEALGRTSIASLDINNYTSDGVNQTTFHLHDRDRAGRIISLEQQTRPGHRDFEVSDSLASSTHDFPFFVPRPYPRLSSEMVNNWLKQQIFDNGPPPSPSDLSFEKLRDAMGLFSRRQTHIQLGHAALNQGSTVVYAMKELRKTTDFTPEATASSRIYNVWMTGRFDPIAIDDAGLVTLRTYARFDGNNLLHPANKVEYHIEAESVTDSEKLFLRGLLQASSQPEKTLDQFKRAHKILSLR